MNKEQFNGLYRKLGEITDELEDLNIYDLYYSSYNDKDKLEHFLNILPNLTKKEIDNLIKGIFLYHKRYFFPNESILDDMKAEKVLENWDKLEI